MRLTCQALKFELSDVSHYSLHNYLVAYRSLGTAVVWVCLGSQGTNFIMYVSAVSLVGAPALYCCNGLLSHTCCRLIYMARVRAIELASKGGLISEVQNNCRGAACSIDHGYFSQKY